MKSISKASILLVLAFLFLSGATHYQKPPQAVLDVLNSSLTPTLAISPTRHFAMQGQPVRYPPIAELAQPMLRIAGMRINPKTNGLHNTTFNSSLTLRKIPEGAEVKVDLPANPKLTLSDAGAPTLPTSPSPTPPSAASNSGWVTPPVRRARSKACASMPSWVAALAVAADAVAPAVAPPTSNGCRTSRPSSSTWSSPTAAPPPPNPSCPPGRTSRKAWAWR